MSKTSEQHSKTMHGDEEKQPESEHNDSPSVQPLHADNNGVDPMLDRSASCYSVATSPSPMSSPSSADVSGRHTPRWSMISASPRFGGMTAQLSFPEHHSDSDASPMQSPSAHSSGYPPGYDPKRIPSSIFSSKSATAADWSAASNESLFSIHVGNGSFSKEELSDRKSLSSLPPLAEVSADYEGKSGKMSDASQVKGVIEAAKQSSENATPPSQAYSSPTNSNVPQIASFNSPRLSNGSVNSCQSFAFPVLVKDISRKPGSQPQPEKQSESQSQPEPPPPPPEAKPETPKEITKAAESSCFTCFSCWPRCC